jgi:quinol monooxygenase YgiN
MAFPANASITIELCPRLVPRQAPALRAQPNFDRGRSITFEPTLPRSVTDDRNRTKGNTVQYCNIPTRQPRPAGTLTRRSAIGAFGAAMAMVNLSSLAVAQSRFQQTEGATTMGQYAMDKKTVSEAVGGGGLLVVAQWEAKDGQADKVADILRQFLPEAQSDPGSKLFLISRGKENPAQFLFYELFVDEAALKAHQDSGYFKTYIAGQALPLLAKRERAQYALL